LFPPLINVQNKHITQSAGQHTLPECCNSPYSIMFHYRHSMLNTHSRALSSSYRLHIPSVLWRYQLGNRDIQPIKPA